MTVRLRAYVVDDEPLAIKRMLALLGETGQVDVVGSATDPATALAFLTDQGESLDVVFLDIEMPVMTGLELARRMPSGPALVFVTAYETFALQAFDVSAVDYLLKPVRSATLERALTKVQRIAGKRASTETVWSAVAQLERMLRTPKAASRIASRVGNRTEFVDLTRVTHFAAEAKLTSAVTAERSYLVDTTIAALEPTLQSSGFFRIHRSTLVNLAFVGELHGGGEAGTFVRLTDPKRTQLTVARDRVRELKERLSG